jgi:hypothetical protein
VASVHKLTIPTEPLVSEVSANFLLIEGVTWSAWRTRGCHVVSVTNPYGRNLGFLERSRYYFFQVAPQLYPRGWVDPVPDHYFFSPCSARESNPDLRICSQELWPLDHRGGPSLIVFLSKFCDVLISLMFPSRRARFRLRRTYTSMAILLGRLTAKVDRKRPAGRISQSRRKAVVIYRSTQTEVFCLVPPTYAALR